MAGVEMAIMLELLLQVVETLNLLMNQHMLEPIFMKSDLI